MGSSAPGSRASASRRVRAPAALLAFAKKGSGGSLSGPQGFRPKAQKPWARSTSCASSKPAAASISTSPAFARPEYGVKASAILPPSPQHPPDLPEPRGGIGPDLQGVDRERGIEGLVLERHALGGAMAQDHHAALDRRGVSRARLGDHRLGKVDSRDPSLGRRPGQEPDPDPRPEPDLQDPLGRLDAQERHDLRGELPVGAGHDQAAQPTEEPLRAPEHAQQDPLFHTKHMK
jgi:hypothetical protein